MDNSGLIEAFTKLVNYYRKHPELQGSAFKHRTYVTTLDAIKRYPKTITSSVDLNDVDGIGKKTLSKIDEFLATGTMEVLNEIKDNPQPLIVIGDKDDLTTILGIGEKTAKKFREMGYNSASELINAYEKGEIKVEKNRLTNMMEIGIKYYKDLHERIPRYQIDSFNDYIKRTFPDITYEICGSYRRGQPDSGDIDMIILSKKDTDFEGFIYKLTKANIVVDTIRHGEQTFGGIVQLEGKYRQLDIKIFEPKSYPFAVLHYTGSDSHNIKLRNIAIDMKYKLNEYGLQNLETTEFVKGIKSEKDIFEALHIAYVPPNERV